jgi:hypothetical protein
MFIKLTNARPEFLNEPIAINADLIVSIFKSTVTRPTGEIVEVTMVFIPPHGNWEVMESVDAVIALANGTELPHGDAYS